MSSIVAHLGRALQFPLAAGTAAFVLAAAPAAAQLSQASKALYQAQLAGNAAGRFSSLAASPLVNTAQVPILDTVVRWDRLRRDAYAGGFAEYASFLAENPGFPASMALRRQAEKKIDAAVSPGERLAYFRRFPPVSAAAKLRFAEALLASGRTAEANAAARDAWDSAGLEPADEAALLEGFEAALRPEDHLGRAERLLWNGQITAAGRLLPRLSMDRRLWMLARIATRGNSPDAQARLNGAPAALRRDPGLVRDEAIWLRRANRLSEAEALLISARPAPGSVFDAQQWMATRLDFGRVAWRSGRFATAYDLLGGHDSYGPGTDVSAQSLSERLAYTEVEWLAGWLALRKLGKPAEAAVHFRNVRNASQTPLSQSRGDYWAGRALEAAGKAAEARAAYEAAAARTEYFYGQLAGERLDRPYRLVKAPIPPVTPDRLATLRADPLVRAAEALGHIEDHDRQSIFLRALVERAETPGEYALVAALAGSLGRPDLGVIAGKSLRGSGEGIGIALFDASWPVLPLPDSLGASRTIIHAITRQESQFDRVARSPSNALGLMQLLPSTAAETASKLGLSPSTSRLSSDPIYNVTLGSAYFGRLRNSFEHTPLAVAAYNAGPGNARKFIAQNGDPRSAGVDVIDWIEAIPFSETRNYVQRVLENAVVYEASFGGASDNAPLSRWLGKSPPG